MFLLQAAQAPVEVKIGNRIVLVQKLRMGEILAWSQSVLEARVNDATDGMSEAQRSEYLTLYPPVAPSFGELRREALTPAGTQFVLKKAFSRNLKARGEDGKDIPPPTQQEIDTIIDCGSPYQLATLALELVDLEDTSRRKSAKDKADENPTRRQGKDESTPSQKTGAETSPSSTPPTPEKTGGN